MFLLLVITPAQAGVVSLFNALLNQPERIEQNSSNLNSQNMPLLQVAFTAGLKNSQGGSGTTIVDGNALVSDYGALGAQFDEASNPSSDQISVYVVRPGDSLSQIADMFDVSVNTIRWANDINRNGTIKEGQVLVILPITGVRYEIKKGDTLASIAKSFNGDSAEIAQFNDLENNSSLTLGSIIIVPRGEIIASAPARPQTGPGGGIGKDVSGYFIRPISGGLKTQGTHGYNGIDLASFYGAEIYAAAAGTVIVSRDSGWNGGYGNYVVIRHNNGTQTLYAHLSNSVVSQGVGVSQGQVIGHMGSTGNSTGTHLHFEVRGARNPF